MVTLPIDEEGYFVLSQDTRLTDEVTGRDLLQKLQMNENGSVSTTWDGELVTVEAFDKPLVARQIIKNNNTLTLIFPYGYERDMIFESLVLDAWDRFHGLTVDKIPFVLSRAAQAEFFNLLDEYTDDSVTLGGKLLEVPPYYIHNDQLDDPAFWHQAYVTKDTTPWDLDGPHPAIDPILPQIKIVRSRIANFGCGRGHDAAFLAKKGHIVYGYDLSVTAIEDAQKLYGGPPNLHFEVANVFDLPTNNENTKYDLILEHTLFCAIPPEKRKDLIQRWHKSLDPQGYLLGIFFVHAQRGGPPWGCSEWELRSLLEKNFRLLYWKRWQQSPERRQGNELVVFAQKISK